MARRAQHCPSMSVADRRSTGLSAAGVAHVVCAAGLFSSVLVLATATEMGAFAPLLIALALYAAIFWVGVELLLWLWWFAQVVKSRRVVAALSSVPGTATGANAPDVSDLSDTSAVSEGRP